MEKNRIVQICLSVYRFALLPSLLLWGGAACTLCSVGPPSKNVCVDLFRTHHHDTTHKHNPFSPLQIVEQRLSQVFGGVAELMAVDGGGALGGQQVNTYLGEHLNLLTEQHNLVF